MVESQRHVSLKKTLIALSIMACIQPVFADEPVFSVGEETPVEAQVQEATQDQPLPPQEQNLQSTEPTTASEEYVFDPNAEPQEPQPAAPISRPMEKPLKPAKGVSKAIKVPMYESTPAGQGKLLGYIKLMQTDYGVEFKPDLDGVRAGQHGFHMHENPNCKPLVDNGAPAAAIAAGGHYDPDNTGKHEGPWGHGHLGDLPTLVADDKGRVETPVLAPRLTMDDVHMRSLIIHEEGDNYSDQPQRLGGGGARIACGVIR